MKHTFHFTIATVLALIACHAQAQTPLGSGFLYQGRLTHDGAPFSGPVGLRFDLFAAESGGAALGSQSIAGVQVTDGLFVVELNAADEFGADAFRGDARWLEVTVEGATLTPRQKLAAAPYALHSLTTRGLSVDTEGKVGIGTATPTSALTVAGTIETTEAGIKFPDGSVQVSAAPAGPGLWATDGEHVFNANTGNVGIGTSAPAAKLDVAGSTRVATLEVAGDQGFSEPYAVFGADSADGRFVNNGPPVHLVDVAAADLHSIGITDNGALVAWGLEPCCGLFGVPGGTFLRVASGTNSAVAIRTDGTLVGWGDNFVGQIDVPTGTFVELSGGYYHYLAIRSDGQLVAWGDNDLGQASPQSGTFVAVAAGSYYSVAIRDDGTLLAWGWDGGGNGILNTPMGTYIQVAATQAGAVAMQADGSLVGWGNYASDTPAGAFVAVAGSVSSHWFAGVRGDGSLETWGSGAVDVPDSSSPGPFTKTACGLYHLVATRPNPNGVPALLLHSDAAFKPGANTWTTLSDRRLKTKINPLENALDKLLDLHGRTYHWRDPATQGNHYGPQMGLIADEVAQVFPAWIGRSPDGYQTLTVSGFEALTVESVRELRREKDEQIARQCEEIADLHTRLDRLEALLGAKADKTEEGVAP